MNKEPSRQWWAASGLALAMAVLAQASSPPAWIAITDFQTDAWCTTAHDRVSGARVTDCTGAIDKPEVPDHKRCRPGQQFVSLRVRTRAGVQIRVVECSNPNANMEQFRADVGEEGMRDCLMRTFAERRTAPPVCNREYVFLTNSPTDRRQPYRLVACSSEQLDRAREYVQSVVTGRGPVPVDEHSNGPRPIPPERLKQLSVKSTFDTVLSEFGAPGRVAPRYPDGLVLIYPTTGGSEAAIELDRARRVARAVVECPEGD